MKTTILCITLLLIGSVFSVNAAKLGLESAWLFDEGGGKVAKDVVSGHDGEIKGTLKWVGDGKFGGALEFPGNGVNYVRVEHDEVFNADPYSFVAWTKLNEASWQYVVWRNGDDWPEPKLVRHLDIWIHDADYAVFMWHVKGVETRMPGKTIVADGKWHHIAKVYDGKSVKMFIDGKLDVEKASGGTLDTSQSPIWIGARPGPVTASGLIDEVGFFTKALTEAQINDVMDDGLADYAAVEATGKATTTWGLLKKQ